jgi:hypothetical protein
MQLHTYLTEISGVHYSLLDLGSILHSFKLYICTTHRIPQIMKTISKLILKYIL